ncbi:Bug family tripartite tricarboxylate transporter substrate binding protein [Bordetella tumulicola]|uniref:Bug family tripartite tricarboxylate transporter substrate binding protein n=1 Tax=Bordetella tumulicola TaxID=1649133 RepID=UPI0039EE541D
MTKLYRRKAIACALFSLASVAMWGARAEAAYPDRPVKLIVPYAAGSAADTLTRVVASALAEQLGQPVVVENKGGAGGTIGTTDIARAKPDGYALGIAAQGTFVNNQALYKSPGYDSIKDFTFISEIADVQNLLVVSDKSPYQSAPALLEAIKAQPPETFRYSSSGVGTSHHIAGATVAKYLDKPIMHVPYTGAQQGLAAIISGDVDMGLYNMPAAMGLVTSGKLRPLAVTGPKRSSLLPDVPTLDESGLKDYSVTLWWGLVGPAGLPADVSTRLYTALNKVMSTQALRDKLISLGFTLPDTPIPQPAAFQDLVRRDLAQWVPVLKQLGTAAQ